MPDLTTDLTKTAKDLANVAKDATYVVIGAGVLGVQQVQVQRRELVKRFGGTTALGDRVAAARADVDGRIDEIMDRFEDLIDRMESAVAPLEDRLPTQARDLAKQARTQAREARTQLRSILPVGA